MTAKAEPTVGKAVSTLNREYSVDRETDPDLKRAFDLMELHKNVKMKVKQGHGGVRDEGLEQARREVDAVLRTLTKTG